MVLVPGSAGAAGGGERQRAQFGTSCAGHGEQEPPRSRGRAGLDWTVSPAPSAVPQHRTELDPGLQDPGTSGKLSSSGPSPAALGCCSWLKAQTGNSGLMDKAPGEGQTGYPGTHRDEMVLLGTSKAF